MYASPPSDDLFARLSDGPTLTRRWGGPGPVERTVVADTGRLTAFAGFQLTASLAPQGTASASQLAPPKAAHSHAPQSVWEFGSDPGYADTYICQERTLAAAASEELILSDGSLDDVFGHDAGLQTVRFVQVELIDNPDGSDGAGSVVVGNAGTNPNQLWLGGTTQTQTVERDGIPFVQGSPAGRAVTSAANRVKVANPDGGRVATYRLTVVGVHA